MWVLSSRFYNPSLFCLFLSKNRTRLLLVLSLQRQIRSGHRHHHFQRLFHSSRGHGPYIRRPTMATETQTPSCHWTASLRLRPLQILVSRRGIYHLTIQTPQVQSSGKRWTRTKVTAGMQCENKYILIVMCNIIGEALGRNIFLISCRS